jgi:hypothetical protein
MDIINIQTMKLKIVRKREEESNNIYYIKVDARCDFDMPNYGREIQKKEKKKMERKKKSTTFYFYYFYDYFFFLFERRSL